MSRDIRADFQRYQLHSAARDGDLSRVQELLRRKYPVNRLDDLDKSPLHYAVAGEHFNVVDCLLKAGANVNVHATPGDTPLGDAAGSCSVETVKRLLDAGADPTIPGWMMLTALDRAEDRKRPEGKKVLELLHAAAKRCPQHDARRTEKTS